MWRRSTAPLQWSVLKASADVWGLATGGETLWAPGLEGQQIWHWMLAFIWTALKEEGAKEKEIT